VAPSGRDDALRRIDQAEEALENAALRYAKARRFCNGEINTGDP